ncbi:MAG: FAD-dependent oxidoreductase [Persicimonas sp.]
MPRKAVAKTDDLQDGDKMQVEVGDLDLLLVRVDGEYFALGAHCTHYGAPLVDGVLSGETLVCPWHHAVFNVTSGEHIEPPGRDCLNKFEVTIEGDDVVVEVAEGAEEHRQPDFCEPDEDDQRHFVILGAGAAGSMAAETLRKSGYTGRISMVTYETSPPYDRPNLSKAYLSGDAEPDWLPLRPSEFYEEHGIRLMADHRVERVDIAAKKVEFAGGESLPYDRLLVATGGVPRRLDIPGHDLDGVFLLRTIGDADAIIGAAEDAQKAVIIGSSFIGMEVAASLSQRDIDVSVVSVDEVPFENVLGADVGRYFLEMHQEHGVGFHLNTSIESIEGDGPARKVVLSDGTEIDADLVVIGVGVRPATDFLEGQLPLNEDGSISVDATMKAADDVWAAGDIVRFPHPKTGDPIRIEHWRLANQHGKCAALNMAGHETGYTEVPFFWTRQFDTSIKYVGHAHDWDEIYIDGDIADGDFIAYYINGDQVLAACGTRGGDLTYLQDAMRRDAAPTPEQVRTGHNPS